MVANEIVVEELLYPGEVEVHLLGVEFDLLSRYRSPGSYVDSGDEMNEVLQ